MACVGAFGKSTVVHESSVVKIDRDIPWTGPVSSAVGSYGVGLSGLRSRHQSGRGRRGHRVWRDRGQRPTRGG